MLLENLKGKKNHPKRQNISWQAGSCLTRGGGSEACLCNLGRNEAVAVSTSFCDLMPSVCSSKNNSTQHQESQGRPSAAPPWLQLREASQKTRAGRADVQEPRACRLMCRPGATAHLWGLREKESELNVAPKLLTPPTFLLTTESSVGLVKYPCRRCQKWGRHLPALRAGYPSPGLVSAPHPTPALECRQDAFQ